VSRVSLPGHDAPSAGFDAPFEMLAACHERVERSLQLLERLGAHLPAHGADAAARDAARDVLRYFDIAAPHHHQDEERHVLPALRAAGQVDLAERIEREHVALAAAWAALRPGLQALADAARAPDPMRDGWPAFAAAYRAPCGAGGLGGVSPRRRPAGRGGPHGDGARDGDAARRAVDAGALTILSRPSRAAGPRAWR
jgi:hypothetical protein